MWMEGEKYPFPGYPRGHLIVNSEHGYSNFSVLKHLIKTKIFNENWHRLERKEEIDLSACDEVYKLAHDMRHDFMPTDKCAPAVREIAKNIKHPVWRSILQAIFQEDDAYRWRFQFMFKFLDKKDILGSLDYAFEMLEHAEVTGDMKERVRLVRRIVMNLAFDPKYSHFFTEFFENVDFEKCKLGKADLYYLRAKYFKADYPEEQY